MLGGAVVLLLGGACVYLVGIPLDMSFLGLIPMALSIPLALIELTLIKKEV